jgi:ribosomal protein S18 acetylase RimI-like enzyme
MTSRFITGKTRILSPKRERPLVRISALVASDTWPLRQMILRPKQRLEEMQFPGDDALPTRHFGAWDDERLVGVATVYRESPHGDDIEDAWRLRGVAVLEEYRRKGVGNALLQACEGHARANGARRIWCNARVTALAFYHKLGFAAEGELFEVPGAGPHYRLLKSLTP